MLLPPGNGDGALVRVLVFHEKAKQARGVFPLLPFPSLPIYNLLSPSKGRVIGSRKMYSALALVVVDSMGFVRSLNVSFEDCTSIHTRRLMNVMVAQSKAE